MKVLRVQLLSYILKESSYQIFCVDLHINDLTLTSLALFHPRLVTENQHSPLIHNLLKPVDQWKPIL